MPLASDRKKKRAKLKCSEDENKEHRIIGENLQVKSLLVIGVIELKKNRPYCVILHFYSKSILMHSKTQILANTAATKKKWLFIVHHR